MGPALISSFRLVPRPVVNISMTTPISAKVEMASLVCTRFRMHGPMIKPARISPTTCGALHLRATRPKNFALRMMIARLRKTEYTKNPSFTIKFPEPYIHSFRRRITESRETADPRLPCRSSSESYYIIFPFHKKIKIFFIISFFGKSLTESTQLAIMNCCLNRHAAHKARCRVLCVPLVL